MTASAVDLTLVLFWTSLGVSAVLVGLFLWLMREDRPEGVRPQPEGEAGPRTELEEDPGASRLTPNA